MDKRRLMRCLALFSIVVILGVPIPALANDDPLDAVEETATETVEETEATVDETTQEVVDPPDAVEEAAGDVEATTDVDEGAEDVAVTTTVAEETTSGAEETAVHVVEAVEESSTDVAPTASENVENATNEPVAVTTQASAPAVTADPAEESSTTTDSPANAGSASKRPRSSNSTNHSSASPTRMEREDVAAGPAPLGSASGGSGRSALKATLSGSLRQSSDGGSVVLQTRQPRDDEDLLDTLIDVGHAIEGPAVLGTRIDRNEASGSQASADPADMPSVLGRTGQALLPFVLVGLCLIALGSLSVSPINQRVTARPFA